MKKPIIFVFLFVIFSCSKKELIEDIPLEFPFAEPASLLLAQQAILTNPVLSVGYVASYPDKKLQVIAAGLKNSKGQLIELNKLILINTTNMAWVNLDFNTNFLPTRAEISNGYLLEFTNYQGTKVDVVLKKKADSKVLQTIKGMELYSGNFELATLGKNYLSQGIDYSKNGRLQGVQACDKTVGGIAAGAYIAQNITGCVLAGAALLLAPEAGLLATFSAGRAAMEACSETKKLIDNLQNNRPAIQCPEAGSAEQSCFSNIVTETGQALSACGQTVANTWLTRKACECNDELRTRDLLDGVGGSTGDPHITTHDGLVYDFQGFGEFVAVQSTQDKFLIQVRQEPHLSTEKSATINTGLAVRMDNDVVNVYSNPFKLLINGVPQAANFTSKRLADNTLITKTDTEIKILGAKGDEVQLRFKNRLDYLVFLAPERKGKVKGLLGDFNGDRINEPSLPDGKTQKDRSFKGLYPTYSDAWRIKQSESIFSYETGKNTDSYTDKKFPYSEFSFTPTLQQNSEQKCRGAGVTREPYLSQCIYDLSLTGDMSFIESAKWTQDLATFSSLPVNADLSFFQNVRLELGSTQNQTNIKNVLDFDTGKTYTFAEAKSNASVDAVAYFDISGNSMSTFGFIKTCGISCGVGSMSNLLNSLQWTYWNKGMIQLCNGSDKAFKLQISNLDFYNVQNSAGVASLLQNKLKKESDYENAQTTLEDFSKGMDTQNVFAFITSQGKQGLFRITGTGINPITKITYYDIDIKIQK